MTVAKKGANYEIDKFLPCINFWYAHAMHGNDNAGNGIAIKLEIICVWSVYPHGQADKSV